MGKTRGGHGRAWQRRRRNTGVMMNNMRLLVGAGAFLVLGCANQPTERSGQVVDRLPASALAAAPQPSARLGLDDIVVLAKTGEGSGDLIARLRASGTRHRLTAAEVMDLAGKGVPLAVIDHLLAGDRQGLLDDCAEQINRREAAALQERQQAELECRQRCSLSCPPVGGWPYYGWPYWRH